MYSEKMGAFIDATFERAFGRKRKATEPMETKLIGNSPDLAQFFPGDTFISAWTSPEVFARYVKEMDQKLAWDHDAWTGSKSFTGTNTMDEALEMAKGGWKEGTERVERVVNRIRAQSPLLSKPVLYGIAGSVPSVPRAVAGNPLNMRTPDLALSRRRPVITLISNICANCGVDAKTITNRAAVVAAIIDHIEAAGFSCEVISVAQSSGYSGYKATNTIVIKNSNQPVDIPRLAFSLGHAAMLRRLVFADWEYEPTAQNGLGSHLGSAQQLKPTQELNDKQIYVIPSANGISTKFKTEEIASTEGLDHLIKSLQKQGCPAFPLTADEKAAIIIKEDDDE